VNAAQPGTRNSAIARSKDAGQTWRTEAPLTWEQARLNYYARFLNIPYAYMHRPAPVGVFHLLVHGSSGHVIAAMGREGVLVRTPDGTWRWTAVGSYQRQDLDRIDEIAALLSGELWLAGAAACLVVSTLTGYPRRRWLRLALLIPPWAAFAAAVLLWPPALSAAAQGFMLTGSFIEFLGPLASWVSGLALPPGVYSVVMLARHSARTLRIAAVTGLAAGLLFILPFGLWSQGGLRDYEMAARFAFALVMATLLAGWLYLRRAGRSDQA
jgi:hypothetical protein